ncbi:molybdopterin-guanine dinucleotide biosynthesis protein B [Candidatus Electronema sp. PJ]|uniref:molybdopterin-guanine dinucleotide biosynthesis protein B n=1 Tax=Candidatus Electronema sp. PJ TaxID=3401572 RepID=UPI003AA7B09B
MSLAIVTFIGWHSCGKTTLVAQVVRQLKERGYRVAVVKSTKDSGLFPDQEGTDTAIHRQAGADAVALVAPDQLCLTVHDQAKDLAAIAQRFFADMDIVIGEGFKEAEAVPKIEVVRGPGPRLRGQVNGVIAVASDCGLLEENSFGLHESSSLVDFLEKRFLLPAES